MPPEISTIKTILMKVEEINNVAVIGAGLMGHGIAQEFALAGYDVRLHDLDGEKLRNAEENIRGNLAMLTGLGLVTKEEAASSHRHITACTVLTDALVEADVVIEAVFEDLNLKQETFRLLDKSCPPRTILASNTSTLLPGLLASVTHRPEKVLVAHYFNPPYLLPLVEIVRHEETSEETVQTMYGLLKKIGKTPVIVQKEVPGFVGNRLQAALFREALAIVRDGIATPEDVDIVVKNGFGRRLAAAGVFEIWEIAGWDLISAICGNLFPNLDASTGTPPLLKGMVDRGELGTKTGKGFYEWTPETALALKRRIAQILARIAQERNTQ
ncbi:MAG TPA: 3-hydroxyacyl-CoA dehydrogenase family protein [Bacteroidota bacterium]